ncbi:MAG: electron transfer flavoprotein subunit beta/FixA family protein [Polyangia bacterium]|nr:electron transfer flavoprotein subunit beta/FixA family protein [Polyangia bacterium]
MKVLVTAKRVPDPEQKVKIKDSQVDVSGMNWVVNPFDEYAVETALRLCEVVKGGKAERFGEVVVLSIGPQDETTKEIRSCLAMGADRAIHVVADDANLDSWVVAQVVKKIYEEEKPDLLLMGKQAVDGDSNQAGQIVAGLLGLAQACFAAHIESFPDKKELVVTREVDGGVELKKVPLPSVVTVDLRIVSPKAIKNNQTEDSYEYGDGPRYASLKGIMKAKKKPIDVKKLGDLGVDTGIRVKHTTFNPPPERAGGVRVKDVAELLDKLQNEAKVL